MDEVCKRILDTVRKYNEDSREICFTDLTTMRIAAPPTIQKRVRELLDMGELIGLSVQTPHGTKRLLFVPERYTDAEGIMQQRLMGMMVYQLRRIADSMERREGRIPKDQEGDGMIQMALWGDEGEASRCPTSVRDAGAPSSTRRGG